jgi:hypothetical protein
VEVRQSRASCWKPLLLLSLGLGLAAPAAAQIEDSEVIEARKAPRGSLSAFGSDSELRAYLKRLRDRGNGAVPPPPMPAPMPPSPPPAAPMAQGVVDSAVGSIVVTGERIANPSLSSASPISITNNQVASVDEGGIVKISGDILVILRRGRLFTVSLAGGRMRPVDSINAFPPGVSGQGDWYDEMLLSGDRVIVVGYSYARGGTEINRFRLSADGRLRFEDAYHLRSNDYYSSRNYASRLIGNRLIFYTPLDLYWDEDPFEFLPGVRRWGPDADKRKFRRIARARDIFIPRILRNSRNAEVDTLHSVTTCDLTAPDLDCTARGVLGPSSRTFYVSADAVYMWISDAWYDDDEDPRRGRKRRAESFVYRLPLTSERPSAIAGRGAPVDQFSFREDAEAGILNVLLRADGGGDWMFSNEVSEGAVALLRLPIHDFGDGSGEIPLRRYRALPSPRGESWSFHNRFVGDHVLYGAGAYGSERGGSVFAARIAGGETAELSLPHAVDRLEVLGRDGLVVGGSERGLGFTAVELPRSGRARLGDLYVHPNSAEGETRSHAFFYSPHDSEGASGVLGLPVARRADPAMARFFGSSAAMLFLHRSERRFSPAGELGATNAGVADDACQASCVDWYGNARPIFLGRRTFALLGYELVEGRLDDGRIRETARISFAPKPAR